MLKKVSLLFLLAAGFALAAAGYRAWRLPSAPVPTEPPAALEVDAARAAATLAAALRIATVSDADADAATAGGAAFDRLHALLAERFPRVHAQLQRETVNGHGLLYTWRGTQAGLSPVLLAAHQDVVPAAAEGWTHPPFAGVIADGVVWGRGALDDKGSLLAMLEAVEALLAEGFVPERTLLLAFGHDEEVGGRRGAAAIAAELARRGVRASFSLDEGGAVTRGVIAGVTRPVATLMVGEKGFLSLRLSLRDEGGHSSTPPRRSVIGRLARAVERLEAQPLPARLIPAVDAMLGRLAPEMAWPARLVMANRDWLQPVVLHALAGTRTTDALILTTTAPTVFRAGERDNVLPAQGEAVLNFRLLPGDTIADVIAHVRTVIADEDIAIEPLPGFNNEAPPASSVEAPAYARIERSIRQVFPEAVVVSGLVLGATDNRHYAGVREQGYYFSPMPYTAADAGRLHGVDERIAIADYARMIRFYAQLLRNSLREP